MIIEHEPDVGNCYNVHPIKQGESIIEYVERVLDLRIGDYVKLQHQYCGIKKDSIGVLLGLRHGARTLAPLASVKFSNQPVETELFVDRLEKFLKKKYWER